MLPTRQNSYLRETGDEWIQAKPSCSQQKIRGECRLCSIGSLHASLPDLHPVRFVIHLARLNLRGNGFLLTVSSLADGGFVRFGVVNQCRLELGADLTVFLLVSLGLLLGFAIDVILVEELPVFALPGGFPADAAAILRHFRRRTRNGKNGEPGPADRNFFYFARNEHLVGRF